MIQLGLRRAAQLFKNNSQPWRAVHVAGTNGKGTVCAYLSALLCSDGITCGRFTSPHLIDRWDCITINEKPVSKALFRKVEADVLQRNKDEKINATEFEVLTATAFDIFTHENVEVGVVEVGMGGRDDATNILKHKAITIITRIGLDHQSFLGNTLEAVTRHKCGILAKDVPVFYNTTNDTSVVSVIKEEAKKTGAAPCRPVAATLPQHLPGSRWDQFLKSVKGREQLQIAISQAWTAYRYLHKTMRPEGQRRNVDVKRRARDAIIDLQWPGRLQRLNINALVLGAGQILLDGAHNAQAAENLAQVVDNELRKRDRNEDGPISWVIASTQGRDIREFLTPLLRPHDRVAAVEFGPVDGMPWVQALPAGDIKTAAMKLHPEVETKICGRDLKAALKWVAHGKVRSSAPVVVTGSLYLASDLLRMLRDAGGDIYQTPASEPNEIKFRRKQPKDKSKKRMSKL
jgi:folylpolyglutamate synthase/dihydrofolate synthase